MDFKDQITQLGDKFTKLKDQIATEEATKNAFIMPFIQALGYDVFNPLEVVPEFIADIGKNKGEKVDYAILKDGLPAIFIECKHWSQKLDIHSNQVVRYFITHSKTKFAIITNGLSYKFYTDLEEPNQMDTKPFLEFDIADIRDAQIDELKKFHKSYFDVNNILNSASELKYTSEIKSILNNEFKAPSEEFVKFFVQKIYEKKSNKKITSNVIFQFSDLVRKSIQGLISDMITDRLKSAIEKEKEKILQSEQEANAAQQSQDKIDENLIVTTPEEMEAFFIVKSILRTIVASDRISYKDSQSYFAVILDDSAKKTICRLHLNRSKKYISTFDTAKNESKNEIVALDDIYNYAEQMKTTVKTYLALQSEK